jgi:hypothetical protein
VIDHVIEQPNAGRTLTLNRTTSQDFFENFSRESQKLRGSIARNRPDCTAKSRNPRTRSERSASQTIIPS